MEVHHHSHSPRKKITHYLWEFLMLFLAVFCGFLAENQREHFLEHRHEKRYMQNLLQDLARDTEHINRQLVFQQRAVKYSDSLVFLLNSPDSKPHLKDIYYYVRVLGIITPFLYSNATVTELKSSGSLRLIRKEFVADSIVQYDVWTQRILTTDQSIREVIRDFRNSLGNVFDAKVINDMSNNRQIQNNGSGSFIIRPDDPIPLITNDRKTINHICILLDFLGSLYQAHFNSLTDQKKRAINIISLIKKEYHLE